MAFQITIERLSSIVMSKGRDGLRFYWEAWTN